MLQDWPRPSRILEYYERSLGTFSVLKTTAKQSPGTIDQRSPFYLMTFAEVETAVEEMVAELNQHVVLSLSASAEATIRRDFLDRVKRRGKDSVSKKFRDLDRKANRRRGGVRLEDILDVWKGGVSDRSMVSAVANLKKLFLYRHWLAHGRYWVENKSGLNNPDVYEVWKILQKFMNLIPGVNL